MAKGNALTRLAVLADIHGNLPALEAVMHDMAPFRPDCVVVNGDVINWGPYSEAVLERVASEGWAITRGNQEYYLLDYGTPRAPAEWSDPDQFSLLPWLRDQLAPHWLNRIAAWPDTLSLRFPDAPPVYVAHGTPRSCWEPFYWSTPEDKASEILSGVDDKTVLLAHTHLPLDRHVGRWRVLNPGSVGVPLDGVPGARYMLLDGNEEGWTPTFRHVPFDYAPLYAEFERQRFIERCGIVGYLVVDEFRTARLRVHPFIMWHRQNCPDAPISMQLLDEFERADPWQYTPPAYHVNLPGVAHSGDRSGAVR